MRVRIPIGAVCFILFSFLLVSSLHAQTELSKYAVLKTEGGEAYLTNSITIIGGNARRNDGHENQHSSVHQ